MKLRRILSGVLAATVAISSMALSAFTALAADAGGDVSADNGIYAKVLSSGTDDQSKRLSAKFAEGTANAAMAGATQVKVTFDMGPNAAFNQYMTFNVDGNVAGTTSTEKIKGNSWTNGEKDKFATVNLPKTLAEGDAYSLSAWTAGFANCNTEDNFVFGIKKAEFLNADGTVLYTHTQVTSDQGAVESPVYTWEGNWTKNKSANFKTDSKSDEVTVKDNTWQMYFDVDISAMKEPVMVVTTPDDKVQAWKGHGTSAANRIANGVDSGTVIAIDDNTVNQFTICGQNMGSITKVVVYDAANGHETTIDYTALDKAIADGEAVDTTKYTEITAKAVTDAVAAAKAVKENTSATQDDVDAAVKALNDAIAALEEVPVEDGLYAKIYFKGYNLAEDQQFVIADGTANAAMAGATQVKVTFDMGAKCAYNQMTKLNIAGTVAGSSVTATLTGSGWPANGVKGYEKTFDLPAALAAGDEYVLKAWTGNWESCKTEDNFVFGISKVEFLNADGTVLYTHTQVEGPEAENSNKVVITDFTGDATFTEGDGSYVAAGTIMLPVKYNNSLDPSKDVCILSDSDIAKIEALMPNISKIGFKVEVTGTIAKEFTLVPTMSGDGWYVSVGSNRGGPYLSTSGAVYEGVKISAPGTYELVIAVNEDKTTSTLSSIIIKSIEYSSKTNNPDATLVLKEMYVEGAGSKPTIDYTTLDEAIAAAEALDASAYTVASYAAVTTALGTAKTVKDNADATQDDVDAAAKALNDAIAALEAAPVLGENDEILYFVTTELDDGTVSLKYASNADSSNCTIIAKDGVLTVPETLNGKTVTKVDSLFNTAPEKPITKVVLPETVTEIIARRGFCSQVGATLEEIVLPENLNALPRSAFQNLSNLKTITIPSGVTEISSSAFYNTGNADTNIYIKGKITSINSSAFGNTQGTIHVYDQATYDLVKAEIDAYGGTAKVVLEGEESGSKVVVNGSEAFINQSNQFYLKLHVSGSDSNLITDDEWAKIKALAPNYTKFTFEVEVTGTVASPFTLVPRLDTRYTSDFDYWYIKADANRGGPFIAKSTEVTFDSFQISEPGTYKLEVILADGTRTSELSDLVTINSLEYNTYTNNPDATVTFKSFTVEGAASVTPEIDYTELDEAIASAEALDASAYTVASYAAVTTALGTAKTVKENAEATQDDVDAAAKALNDAIAALEEVPPAEVVKSYDVSANGDGSVTATIYSDGTFRISGTGDTKNYGVGNPNGLGPWYSDKSYSQVTKVIVDEGITSIGSYLLASLKNATTATIPSTVTSIGIGAFSQSGYKDIKISGTSNITSLGENAFYWCRSLETVDDGFLSNLTEIPDSCFFNCSLLKPISIPDNITRIGDGAFNGCTAFDTVVFPENLTYIGDHAFSDCPFTTIKIPDAVTYIGNMAFSTSTLANVEISDNSKLETIGELAFSDAAFTTINLPEGLKSIGAYAFCRSSLTSIEFPSTLTEIGRNAFMNCSKLTGDVIVPEGVTVLNDSVFSSCSNENLNLYIKGAITSVGKNPFGLCAGKIYVYDQNTYDLISNTYYGTAELILVKDEGPDYTALDKAISDGEAVDTTKYTDDTVKALTDAITAGKAVKENASATQDDVDAAAKAITDAIDALVSNVRVADWTEADKWYAVAKDLLANHKDEYTEKGIVDIERAISTYDSYNRPDLSQGMVDWLANLMKINIEGAEKPNTNAALADLKKTIEQAEAIDLSAYTEETAAALTTALEAAKAMNENSAYDDVREADRVLKNAIDGLVLIEVALDPLVYIYKNGAVASIASGKADDEIAGTTQIRFTFDCASDVSYNEYASIELKAVVSGTESYKKFPGTGGYVSGAKGLTETLDLTNAIAAGQVYSIEGFTYAWSNAADYVYAVTKVEFIDADGNVLKTIKKPEEISLDELNKAIEKAEAIDTTLYTDETVKALTDAIAAAKKVTTASTEEEAQAAIDAINAAIEALELKPIVTTFKVAGKVLVSDEDASTEMTLVAEAADGTKVTATATSMGEYVLEGLAAGDYTLTISGGKYVERTYEITIAESDLAMNVNLNPLGDINGDGKVTTADVGMANSHAKGVKTLEGYAFACTDANKDGSITTADVGMINSHAKAVKTLW